MKYEYYRNATMVLQCGFRIRRRHRASIKIQSWWRKCKAASTYRTAKRSANVIESGVRQFLATCRRRHAAATTIQKAWVDSQQRFLVRCILVLGRAKAAIVLQRWWREIQLLRQHKQMLSDAKKRRTIDDARRRKQEKEDYNPMSLFCNFGCGTGLITQIVPWAGAEAGAETTSPIVDDGEKRRTKSVRSKHLDTKLKARAAVIVQRHWRQYWRIRTKENYYLSVSAALIQCIWRGYNTRRRYKLMLGNRAATSLQTAWQDIEMKRVVTQQIVLIQALWRGYVQRCEYEYAQILRRGGATLLQRVFRQQRERKRFLQARSAAKRIQRLARSVAQRDVAARKIQQFWRDYQLRVSASKEQGGRRGTSLPAMVLQAGVAWILSDPRVIEFALKGGSGA